MHLPDGLHLIILEKGTVVREGTPREIFQEEAWLKTKQLGVPSAVSFSNQLDAKLGVLNTHPALTATELADSIADRLKALKAGEFN